MSHTSVTSRIRVTGTGKLIKRTMGVGHNRAKKSRKQLQRKTDNSVNPVDVKMFKKYLSI